jgi:hypothetical protein
MQAQADVDPKISDDNTLATTPRSVLSTLNLNSRPNNINKGLQCLDKPPLNLTPGSLLPHPQQPTLISAPATLTEEEAQVFSDAGIPLLTIGEDGHQLFFCYGCKSAIPGNFFEVHFKMPTQSKKISGKVYQHTSPSPGILALVQADLKTMFKKLVIVGEGNKLSPEIRATLFLHRNLSTHLGPNTQIYVMGLRPTIVGMNAQL